MIVQRLEERHLKRDMNLFSHVTSRKNFYEMLWSGKNYIDLCWNIQQQYFRYFVGTFHMPPFVAFRNFLAGNYIFKVNNRKHKVWHMFKVNNKDTRMMPRRQWHRSGVLIVNFEHIWHLVLLFLLLTLSR